MSIAYATIAVLLMALVVLRQRQPAPGHADIARHGWKQLRPLLIRIPPALLAGSFLAVMIPQALAVAWLGDASGLGGIALATVIGAILPGGPFITFPLVLALTEAGIGMPQMVTLITSWSVLAFHRMLVFEVPSLGWRLTGIRLAASLLLPAMAGLLTLGLAALLQ